MSFDNLSYYFEKHEDKTAWESEKESLSYKELWQKVLQLESSLKKSGLRKKTRVALSLSTPEETLLHLFALWNLDTSVVLLSPKFPKEHQDSLFEQAPYHFKIQDENLWTADSSKIQLVPNEALIVFTSGTSGPPKGVVLSKEALYYSALGTNDFYHLTSDDSWQLSLPLFHVGGLMIALRCLIAGAKVVFKKTSTSFYSLVPTQLQNSLDNSQQLLELKKAKAILLGGAKASEEMLNNAKKNNLPISVTYGQSECCAQLTATHPGSFQDSSFVGTVLPYRKIIVSDKGLISIGGKTLFSGYLEKGSLARPFKEGFFQTSDLGIYSQDGLKLQGRGDNIFISGGENISPKEIQNALMQYNGIEEVMIIPVPHKRFANVPFAFYIASKKVNEDKLRDFLKGKLPPYKIPKYFKDISTLTPKGIKFSYEELYEIASKEIEL